jgi:hypothetical protein
MLTKKQINIIFKCEKKKKKKEMTYSGEWGWWVRLIVWTLFTISVVL